MGRLGSIINSSKEIVDSTLLGVAAGTQSNVSLATQINDYVGTVGTVPLGSVIKSFFLFVQVLPTAGTANVDWYFYKGPSALAIPVPGATGGTPARKYIFHEEKGIPGNSSDGAFPATFKSVIRLPKGRQRFAEGDVALVAIRGTDIHNACVKAVYKRFT